MKRFLFVFVFFLGVFLLASDIDFDYTSKTCNICGASFGWHTLCTKCGHVMCDYLEPSCKFCAGTDASYTGSFDPSNLGGGEGSGDDFDDGSGDDGGDDGGDDPGNNPMINSQTSSGGVTTTTYTDGSISISGSDGGSGSFDLKPGSDLSVRFYSDGSKIVTGIDAEGNPFSFTVYADGRSINGISLDLWEQTPVGTNTATVPGLDSGDSDNPYFGDGNDPFDSPDNPDPENPGDPDPDPENPGDPDPDPENPGDPNPETPQNPGDGLGTKVEVTNWPVIDPKVEITNWPVTSYSYLPGQPDLLDSIDSDSSFLDTFCRKFLPHLPSVSGANDIFIPIDFDLSGFPVNLGRLSFVLGGFHSVLDGALVPVMSFCRAFSIFLFVFFFSLAVVRALRQW